ncbi:MAG: HDIG domain-containing metalloprotein [candidate division Zixibacteria bacterium]
MKFSFKKKNNVALKGADNGKELFGDDSLRGHKLLFRVSLAALLVFGITFLYPIDKIYQPIEVPQVGEIAAEDLSAPFDFPILKSDDELKKDRRLAMSNLRPVIVYDTVLSAAVSDGIRRFFATVDSLGALHLGTESFTQALRYQFPSLPARIITTIADTSSAGELARFCVETIDSVISAGVIADVENLPFEESGLLTLQKRDETITLVRDLLKDIERAELNITGYAYSRFESDENLANAAVEIIGHFLEPNLQYDKEATERNKNAALQAITEDKGWVYKDELIIKSNERITELHSDKLLSLARFKRQKFSQSNFWQFLLPPLGRLFFVAFPILFFGFYIYYFRKNIFASNSALVLFSILIGGLIIILYIIISQPYLSPYLVPVTIVSMLATIAYDLETGLFLTFALAVMIGVLTGFKLDVAFVAIAAGTVAAYSVRKVRHRHEFYRSILYLSVVYFGVVYIIESLKLTPTADLWRHSGLAILNGFISPILTIGLLPLFESTFKLTTDITLLELSDLNRPLLKRLALEAPGTYHHSIMIGTLAEEAAKSISANSLLARVGSYYHDIGKMLKPEYFVENQVGGRNKHEKLVPSMSALILEAHVREGKELAEEHGLPDCIIEFITGHHGTSVMTYFLEKEKQLKDGDDVNVDEYRYPGPKPKSKEVAIVMLADSAEAASRTLENPTSARIRNLVKRISAAKFESSELEGCDLTLNELHLIEESFIRVLIGIFHKRIAYPDDDEADK